MDATAKIEGTSSVKMPMAGKDSNPVDKRQSEMKKVKFSLDPKGTTGTSIFSGIISEEYLDEWRVVSKRIESITRMLSSDATLKALQHCIELPIRSGVFDIAVPHKTAEKADPQLVEEIESFVKKNLFEEMETSWDDFIRQALQAVFYGFFPFEIVHMVDGDRVKVKDLSPRLPKSFHKWELDERGKLAGMWQRAPFPKGDRSDYKTVLIPAEYLVLFTYRQNGSNFEGESVLRACFKHWLYKDKIYLIQGIGIERNAVGEPVFMLPEQYDEDIWEYAKSLVKSWRTHEEQGAVIPYGATLTTSSGRIEAAAIMYAIQHHDTEMVKAVLAHFINLGTQGAGGAYSLGVEMADFFMMGLKAISNWLCDTINKKIIKPLVLINWPDAEIFPELGCKELGRMDRAGYATLLSTLVQARLLTPDKDLEQWAREVFELPPMGGVAKGVREGEKVETDANIQQLLNNMYQQRSQMQQAIQGEQQGIPATQSMQQAQMSPQQQQQQQPSMQYSERAAGFVNQLVNLREELVRMQEAPLNISVGGTPIGEYLGNAFEEAFQYEGKRALQEALDSAGYTFNLPERFLDEYAAGIKHALSGCMRGSMRVFNEVYQFENTYRSGQSGKFTEKPGGPMRSAMQRAIIMEARRIARKAARAAAKSSVDMLPAPEPVKRIMTNIAGELAISATGQPFRVAVDSAINRYFERKGINPKPGENVNIPLGAVPEIVGELRQNIPGIIEKKVPNFIDHGRPMNIPNAQSSGYMPYYDKTGKDIDYRPTGSKRTAQGDFYYGSPGSPAPKKNKNTVQTSKFNIAMTDILDEYVRRRNSDA